MVRTNIRSENDNKGFFELQRFGAQEKIYWDYKEYQDPESEGEPLMFYIVSPASYGTYYSADISLSPDFYGSDSSYTEREVRPIHGGYSVQQRCISSDT